MFAVWFGSRTILGQEIQARFYGMMLGAAAFALYASIRSARETDDGRPVRFSTLAATFVANLLLVSAHPFGFLYSAAILFAAGVSDGSRAAVAPGSTW